MREYLQIARQRAALPAALFDDPVVTWQVDEPLVLVLFGDQHLGGVGVDYDLLEQDLDLLRLARHELGDRLKLLVNGDVIDGYMPSGTPANPYQVLSPGEQRAAAYAMFDHVKPDVLIEADHDNWHSKQSLEHSWMYEYARANHIYFAQWGMKLILKCAPRDVVGLLRHRYKGSVATDHLKPHKNLHKDLGPADFTMVNHFHSFAGVYKTHSVRRNEPPFWAIQGGTYKRLDDYGKKIAGTEADYGVPALVVYPDGKLDPYNKFEEALTDVL